MATLLARLNYSRLPSLLNRFKLARISHIQTIRLQSSSSPNDKQQDEPSNKSEPSSRSKTTKANHPITESGPVNWRSFFIGGTMLSLFTGYFLYLKNKRLEKMEKEKSKSYGKAAIGGAFELVDTEGKVRSSDEFKGKWLIIYFGFTNCPDVCPEELEKIATVVDGLKKQNVEVLPLFITVDPERDTPERIGRYLKEFSDDFIGLTGTKEQIETATRAYRIYYSVGPKDKDNDYIVDHTIISYLVSPTGELIDYFGQTKLAQEMENLILFTVKTFKPQ